ncbi:MAG: acyl-coenzyme A thioesterase PaaI-like protein [Desulforhopalus sp.]|jgi:acyl-coenzyme A thioesterase PaaI-like protein
MDQLNKEQTPVATHRHCLMCGQNNPFSFGLKFSKQGEGCVSTTFTGNETLQGYDGILHGGVLSALLDTAMAHCLLHENIEAMTGELNVRFIDPVACNSTMAITAWIDSSLPPLYCLKSQIRINNKIVCKAKAKFMQRDYNER